MNTNVQLNILFFIASRNLVHKKLRTGLTLFGIAIGIGAIYFLLSFGIGLQHVVTNEVIGNQSIKTVDVSTPNSKIIKLDDITTERIRNIEQVDKIGKAYYFPGSFKISNSESDAIVYGIDAGYEDLTYLNITEGTLLSKAEDKNPIVLNKSALNAIGITDNQKEILGKKVQVIVPLSKTDGKLGTYTHEFTVVGIIDSGSGTEIFIPADVFKQIGVAELTQLKAGVRSVSDVKTVRTQIESYGLETTSPVDTLDQINGIFHYLNFILVGFGGIGMIVAILGMFNTLTISLLERTKEIGLMIALGARAVDIQVLFMIEALMLSILGAITGIAGAVILGKFINLIMNLFAHSRGVQDSFQLFANPWWLIIGVMLFMIAVGLDVVYLPARQAQKINPIDALRRE